MKSVKEIIVSYTPLLYELYDQKHAGQVMVWILEYITGKKNAFFLAYPQYLLTKQEYAQLLSALDSLINKEYPLQYILKTTPFLNLELAVEPPLLIPRPETEEWLCQLLEYLKDYKELPLSILDLGTGTGCIALSLAHFFKKSSVYAVDKNPFALEVTQRNAEKNKLVNVVAIQSDMFKTLDKTIKFDLIVSNPPYLTKEEWHDASNTVKKWEDKDALIAKDEGLYFYKMIAKKAKSYLKKDSLLKNKVQIVVEHGAEQQQKIAIIFAESGYSIVKQTTDAADKPRTLWIKI